MSDWWFFLMNGGIPVFNCDKHLVILPGKNYSEMLPKNIRRFLITAQITLIFVYLVIIAGSVVRATGSGMGCPDWPKCFGKWVPPTNVSELPVDYKERYAGEHHAVAEFNALNTWTEYLNRLAGALLGFLIFIQFLFSIGLRKDDKWLFRYSLIELILIGFQGWLGAKVVSSNLAPVKITIHMIVALVILSIAILIIYRAKKIINVAAQPAMDPLMKKISIAIFTGTILQILLGTQVREEVDVLLKNIDPVYRNEIIGNLGAFFKIHRTFAIIIAVLNGWIIFRIRKMENAISVKKISSWLGTMVLIALITGVTLSAFALPAPVQPIHLLVACIIYGLQWMLILKIFERAVK
jgi:cytochrome c oxidase assembly protein subunit 15